LNATKRKRAHRYASDNFRNGTTVMPEGFEHHKAEIASARIASIGGIKFSVSEGHSSLAKVEQTPTGVAA
jgi:hypothetical protein